MNAGLFDPAPCAQIAGTLGTTFVHPDDEIIVDVLIIDNIKWRASGAVTLWVLMYPADHLTIVVNLNLGAQGIPREVWGLNSIMLYVYAVLYVMSKLGGGHLTPPIFRTPSHRFVRRFANANSFFDDGFFRRFPLGFASTKKCHLLRLFFGRHFHDNLYIVIFPHDGIVIRPPASIVNCPHVGIEDLPHA